MLEIPFKAVTSGCSLYVSAISVTSCTETFRRLKDSFVCFRTAEYIAHLHSSEFHFGEIFKQIKLLHHKLT